MIPAGVRGRRFSLGTVLLLSALSLLVGILLATGFSLAPRATAERFWTELSISSPGDVVVAGRPESFAGLVKRIKGAVVNISTTKRVRLPKDHPDVQDPTPEGSNPGDLFDRFFGGRERNFNQRNLGSGVIIHPDGFILTNDHVVEDTEVIRVRLSTGKLHQAEIVGRDPKTDLALIKIRTSDPLPVAPIGNSDRLEVGDWVLAIGNPFGFDHSVTAGIISGKGRVLGTGPYDDYLQTDAAINPGNSGGPLFNLRGEVVGINTAIIPRSQFGFAIPSNVAKGILLQLKARGKVTRGWLGIVVQQVTPPAAESLGVKESRGALVSEVMGDSPAQRAGIQPGDVIVQFGGKPVAEVRDLPRLVADTPVGTEVEVGILRDGNGKTVRVRVGELREERLVRGRPPDLELGLTVHQLTPELAKKLGTSGTSGVVVVRVAPGSPAEEAGLRQGDFVLEVNRKLVSTLEEFQAALRERPATGGLLFLVRRGETRRYFAMRGK
jgi:serine protease Do